MKTFPTIAIAVAVATATFALDGPSRASADTRDAAPTVEFLTSVPTPSTPAASGDPRIAVAPDGTIFLVTFAGSAPTRDVVVTKLSPSAEIVLDRTVFGGAGDDVPTRVLRDANGDLYVVGSTTSSDFPTTPGAFDRTLGGARDGFVTKLTPDLTIVYSTLLGGGSDDRILGAVVEPAGTVIVAGSTKSPDFPTTPGAADTTFDVGSGSVAIDGFVARLAADGASLAASTFFGGPLEISDVARAPDGSLYTLGSAVPDYPVTPGALAEGYATGSNAGVTHFSADLSTVVASARLGFAPSTAITVDGQGAVYIVGRIGAPQLDDNSFVKLNASLSARVYTLDVDNGSFGSGDVRAVAVDAGGRAYVVGATTNSSLATPGAYDTTLANMDGFFGVLAPDGSAFEYFTYLGGGGCENFGVFDDTTDVALAPGGSVTVVGATGSCAWPPGRVGPVYVMQFGFGTGPGLDTVGVYVPSTSAWFLRNTNDGGPANLAFNYGPAGAGWVALRGDWDGDGVDTPGLYDAATGFFFLRNANAPGGADLVFSFGAGGPDVVPVVGDFDGDGIDTVGVYVRSTGAFFLKNSNAPGGADVVFAYGPAGPDLVPIFGDWDGDGTDTVGVYDRATGAFFLRNENGAGGADLAFAFGAGGPDVEPLAGDFDGDGVDTVGFYVPATGVFFLENENRSGPASSVVFFGVSGLTPLVGDWNGS